MADAPAPIDARGPRFAAAITAAVLLVGTVLALTGTATAAAASPAARLTDPAFLLLLAAALLFAWGVLSAATAPWGVLFRRVVQPHLAPPRELEDPRPPRFAQGVGLFVVGVGVGVGLVLHAVGVPWALSIAAAAAFLAAFLNAAFGFCLGCELYLLLRRAGIVPAA